ncbi:glycosyltransferase family 2 protein [Nakamurella leprariae]|uniref:Glycosyltransferase family 2 protein n=1 Tax=Nakamurella leprariae TaxID=2803911 RepID=A0A938YAJ5_9ACTN|nr:glycosyltransferase family 2 protein [Nakamurella leprariae]MBM9467042.1 glycosyltransferase family 2 protein [Nakamurella leprariae]
MSWFMLIVVVGVSTVVWSLVGLGRLVAERIGRTGPAGAGRRGRVGPDGSALQPADVAVLVAAHDEELVIAGTIAAAATLVPVHHIHVISDGSSDRTAEIARAAGAQVLSLSPNRGKAGALAAGIEHFALDRTFEVVMLLDADTHLAPDYLATGLPLFDDPGVVAVAGRAKSITDPAPATRSGRLLVAYRERLYLIVQLLFKYGQAARWANAVAIVPGFASMYRARVLPSIDIAAPGLVIEDFNMTFEVHARRLGRIEFHPSAAIAHTQDPDSFRDYTKQTRRWILGHWQTLRRHRPRPTVFWASTIVYTLELIGASLLWVLLVPLLVITTIGSLEPTASTVWTARMADWLAPHDLLLGVVFPDVLLTAFAAVVLRKPRMLLLGLVFPAVRVLDATLCLRALGDALVARSSGIWSSPARRSNQTEPAPATGVPVVSVAGPAGPVPLSPVPLSPVPVTPVPVVALAASAVPAARHAGAMPVPVAAGAAPAPFAAPAWTMTEPVTEPMRSAPPIPTVAAPVETVGPPSAVVTGDPVTGCQVPESMSVDRVVPLTTGEPSGPIALSDPVDRRFAPPAEPGHLPAHAAGPRHLRTRGATAGTPAAEPPPSSGGGRHRRGR